MEEIDVDAAVAVIVTGVETVDVIDVDVETADAGTGDAAIGIVIADAETGDGITAVDVETGDGMAAVAAIGTVNVMMTVTAMETADVIAVVKMQRYSVPEKAVRIQNLADVAVAAATEDADAVTKQKTMHQEMICPGGAMTALPGLYAY